MIDQNEPFSKTSDDYKFEIRKGPQICDMNKIIKSEVFIFILHITYYHIIKHDVFFLLDFTIKDFSLVHDAGPSRNN